MASCCSGTSPLTRSAAAGFGSGRAGAAATQAMNDNVGMGTPMTWIKEGGNCEREISGIYLTQYLGQITRIYFD